MVEATTTGTPVIAYPRGSMPEIIRRGVSRFLVDGVDQAVAADALARFFADRMVDDYERLFRHIVNDAVPGRGPRHPNPADG